MLKRSERFERLLLYFERGGVTSAEEWIDEPAVKVKNEPQKSDRSAELDDLNEKDCPSQDSFKVDSDFSDLTLSSFRSTESEGETLISCSSSTSSRRSAIDRAPFLVYPAQSNIEPIMTAENQ